MSDLVERLSARQHPVEVSLRPDKTVAEFKRSLDRGFVPIRFTDTRGGTELSIPVDRQQTDVTRADFEAGTGHVTLVGSLILDYVAVKCVAVIDLSSLVGAAQLEPTSRSDVAGM